MRIRNVLPAVAVLAIAFAPALAQDAPAGPMPPGATAEVGAEATLSADQQAQYDAWPPAQQAQFDAWPAETQAYFWSLTGDRQELFWRLADSDKVTLAGLPAEQQDRAWAQIEAQVAGGTVAGTPDDDGAGETPM